MSSIRAESKFSRLSLIPLDPTYALKELFYADNHPNKAIAGCMLSLRYPVLARKKFLVITLVNTKNVVYVAQAMDAAVRKYR
jgi:hypothetical protein